jgi:hypothetical protein
MNGFELNRKMEERMYRCQLRSSLLLKINEDKFSKVMPPIKVRDFIKKPIRIPEQVEKLKEILA